LEVAQIGEPGDGVFDKAGALEQSDLRAVAS
jgi:hypothetical protein